VPDRHRRAPISFRPAEDDHDWLLGYAAATGQPVNAILRIALARYRASVKRPSKLDQLRARASAGRM
jgi:hypothetical protein